MAKRYSSIVDMMRELTEDDTFADGLAGHLAQRRLVLELSALRAAKGLTQQEIAEKLKCTQGRISKLESSTDGDLDIATLLQYAGAIDHRVEVSLIPKEATLAERIKHHAFSIKRLTDEMAKLGSKDRKIADGVGEFLKEAAFNLVRLVHSSTKYLSSAKEEPRPFVVNVYTSNDDEGSDVKESAKPIKRGKRIPQ